MKTMFTIVAMMAAGFLGFKYEPRLREWLTGVGPGESSGIVKSAANDAPIPAQEAEEESMAPSARVKAMPPGQTAEAEPVDPYPAGVADEPGVTPVSDTVVAEAEVAAVPPTEESMPAEVPTNHLAGESAEPVQEPTKPTFISPDHAEPLERADLKPEPLSSAQAPTSVIDLMKQSVAAGDIHEFTLDKAELWELGPDETLGGVSYRTGLVTYQAETIFGVKKLQAKALVLDGKVVKWVRPKSRLEIK